MFCPQPNKFSNTQFPYSFDDNDNDDDFFSLRALSFM